MEEPKKSMVGAVGLSIASVCMLFVFIGRAAKGNSEFAEIVHMLAILGLVASGISHWVKYLKQYVEFAIEQKLKTDGEKAKD